MNIFKGTLDTRQQNGVIATVTQFDNATLELQIVTDGQVSEAWESPQFELIAMKRDNNPVREVDQDHFTILSKEEHKVRIELKEQFLTCRGTVKMQLIIKDGGRESTTIFYLLVGQSLDRDIIESRVDVKVLDDLEIYIQTGREVIYDAQAIVTDLKDEMSEFNASSSEKEAERQASELNRASKELNRIDNEETRVTNEHDRVTNEEGRVTNEEERVANEQDRVTNEQNRRLAENTRIAQERARQDAELQRNSIFEENETIRKDGEKKRITNENEREKKFSTWEERETTRLKSEENRIIQEKERVINEEERQRQEQTRQNQEDYRQRTYSQFNEAEASRVNKELQRQSAEEKRVAAEANRQSNYVESENERDRQYAEAEEIRNNAFAQNEANRQSEYTEAERERVESEELRKSRERERETAESQRATTERERVNAEQKRAADFNREIENIQNTMNQAVSNVNGAIDTANSTMEGIEQRAEECLPVIEQSSNEIERARVDYIGNQHSSIKKANDANVDWLLGEVNTAHYEGQHITALDTLEGQAKSAILSGNTGYRDIDTGEFLETFEEGRNLELVSVRMPVLTTVGKNLLNIEDISTSSIDGNTVERIERGFKITTSTTSSGWGQNVVVDIDVKENTDYVYSVTKNVIIDTYPNGNVTWSTGFTFIRGIQSDGVFIERRIYDNTRTSFKFNTKKNNRIRIIHCATTDLNPQAGEYDLIDFQLEEASSATAYEPYKTNILMVNEDVTLRGIGDVQDTLDCLTGEVTERIGEYTIDGNENWEIHGYFNVDGYKSFVTTITGLNNFYSGSTIIISGDFKSGSWNDYTGKKAEEMVWNHDPNKIGIKVKNETASNVEELKAYLASNPITFQYELATESIKTVDLSDNHVYSYKDVTHYDCSSAEGSLVPTLSIDVPTNLPAVVTRQRVTIQELEKENVALKNEIEETANSSVNGDLELMTSQFELDFRLFEIEMNLDMPMMAMMRGVKSMAMTVYQQAKTLILAGKYEREDMEYKLNRYKAAGRITVEEYEELIALMDARELVD